MAKIYSNWKTSSEEGLQVDISLLIANICSFQNQSLLQCSGKEVKRSPVPTGVGRVSAERKAHPTAD